MSSRRFLALSATEAEAPARVTMCIEMSTKAPRFTNVVATLLAQQDNDGVLADNRNSDAAHNIKLTGQGAGFPAVLRAAWSLGPSTRTKREKAWRRACRCARTDSQARSRT
ncbi:MAG: hypothetical protein U0787_10045 [Polyangia bacterium]